MTNHQQNQQLHVIFGSGAVGMAVMEELVVQGQRVRLVNRRGQAKVPTGVEVAAGDATPLPETIHTTVDWFRQNPK